jgi:hypothetical protein
MDPQYVDQQKEKIAQEVNKLAGNRHTWMVY